MERERSQVFISSLEGVRGYAFFIVFLVHFQADNLKPSHLWQWPRFVFISLGWLAVPVFFVLSGYLITGILLRTKGRTGYFRVFYARRALRVFPLYYAALVAVAVIGWLRHWSFKWNQLSYLLYAQNLFPNFDFWTISPHVSLGHLWSMALEEQFYVIWPIVLWLCPTRRAAAQACGAVIVLCFVTRFAWPLFHLPMLMAYYFPLTRADEIACGALVAIWRGGAVIPLWARKWSVAGASAGLFLLAWRAVETGLSMSWNYFNIAFMTPIADFVCTALLILLLCEDSLVSRVCSKPWICHFGRLSYGMYVVHGLIFLYFSQCVAARLNPMIGRVPSRVLAGICAFLTIWLVAYLGYLWIEKPAMRVKTWFQYGSLQPEGRSRLTFKKGEPAYSSVGSGETLSNGPHGWVAGEGLPEGFVREAQA